MTLFDAFRFQPVAVTLFGLGLALLAVSGVGVGVALWSGTRSDRLAGLLAAAGLVLFLPQFFGPPEVRVAHGVLLAVGLLLLARVSGRDPA